MRPFPNRSHLNTPPTRADNLGTWRFQGGPRTRQVTNLKQTATQANGCRENLGIPGHRCYPANPSSPGDHPGNGGGLYSLIRLDPVGKVSMGTVPCYKEVRIQEI